MDNFSSQAQNIFTQLQYPEEAFQLMRYQDRVQRIIDDTTLSIEEKAFRIISSQLFRSISFPEENQIYLRNKIHQSFEKKEKLTFILGFGAYKTHYSYSFPYPNFAEIYNILYMKVFAYVLKKVYPFNVEILYVPAFKEHVSEITAISQEHLKKYHKALEEVFHYLVQPSDSLMYMTNEEQYKKLNLTADDIRDVVLEKISSHTETLSDELIVTLLENTHIGGLESSTTHELVSHVKRMYLYHEFYVSFAYNALLKAFPDAIPITPRKKVPYYLTSLKCFFNSVVQFWVGDGIFLKQEQEFFPTIASKNQIKSLHFSDFAKVEDPKLGKISNYFKHIPIYEKTND